MSSRNSLLERTAGTLRRRPGLSEATDEGVNDGVRVVPTSVSSESTASPLDPSIPLGRHANAPAIAVPDGAVGKREVADVEQSISRLLRLTESRDFPEGAFQTEDLPGFQSGGTAQPLIEGLDFQPGIGYRINEYGEIELKSNYHQFTRPAHITSGRYSRADFAIARGKRHETKTIEQQIGGLDWLTGEEKERLRSLVAKWEGHLRQGEVITESFSLGAAGTGVISAQMTETGISVELWRPEPYNEETREKIRQWYGRALEDGFVLAQELYFSDVETFVTEYGMTVSEARELAVLVGEAVVEVLELSVDTLPTLLSLAKGLPAPGKVPTKTEDAVELAGKVSDFLQTRKDIHSFLKGEGQVERFLSAGEKTDRIKRRIQAARERKRLTEERHGVGDNPQNTLGEGDVRPMMDFTYR